DGLINHQLFASSLKSKLLRARYELSYKRNPRPIAHKENGYHLYNLHPFARLYKIFPDHPLFSSQKFTSAIQYTQSISFLNELRENKYAFPYNSPAFEFPLI